jgi:signal transduction histidine kinase
VCWRIAVRDNGLGIDPEQAGKVFGLFERLHSKDHYPGAGIGLALTERIIDAHGGRIWAAPNAGRGTTITMTLPDDPSLR